MLLRLYRSLLVVLVVVLAGTLAAGQGLPQAAHAAVNLSQPQAPAQADWPQLEKLLADAKAQGQVRVIVGLHLAGYNAESMAADAGQAAVHQTAIASGQAGLLNRLQAHAPAAVTTFEYVPYLAMTVDAAGLAALAADPQVASIEEDLLLDVQLSDTVTQVRADYAHLISYRGQGHVIAVLDTGINKFHPALAGKVVSEACYSTNDAGLGLSSTCPGGATSSTATNSGLHCSVAVSGCDHGTLVSGASAAIAPGASLISIQVASRRASGCSYTSPCVSIINSNWISALNRVYALRNTYSIASVNMSFGSGSYTSTCNTASSAAFDAVNLVRGAGIVVVAGSGNDSFKSGMIFPACMSNVVSVGAVTKTGQVSDFSNVSTATTLLAPGSDIYGPSQNASGNTYRTVNGTSIASPHVAGAVALLKNASPNASANQLISALSNNGSLIADQRPGGIYTRRSLDVWTAVCSLITCDADDFRILNANSSLNGSITPSSDVDHYYYFGQAGQLLTLILNRTSGGLDPFVELLSPTGIRVAFNDNGGGGVNALINGYTLAQNGMYVIRVRNTGLPATGNYQLTASHQTVPLNPTPRIDRLSPGAATATPFGSDFWVAIYGANFMPQSQVYWNGQLRSMFYSSSSLIYIRVRGSDIGGFPPPPRLATVRVVNPAPGGGASNNYPFNINLPFLGETELLSPASGSRVETGISTTLVISWTHPTLSWRDMQNMDVILRNENSETAMWLRMSEDTTVTVSLLNSSGTPVISTTMLSGQFGQGPDLVISDTVTLHTEQTFIFGSGRTLIVSPTLTFGPQAVGVWNIEFTVDNASGEIQDDDVLGTLIIHPPGCPSPLADVSLTGPVTGTIGLPYDFSAQLDPLDATGPITYTWSPEPASGQGTPNATYTWTEAGEQVVAVNVENCGGFAAAAHSQRVATVLTADLALSKTGPAVARAGELITYTLAMANLGAQTAHGLVLTDVLPAGAHHVSGGSLAGSLVTWNLAELEGYGTLTYTTLVVTASTSLNNADYSVSAAGLPTSIGSPGVETLLVDDHAPLTPVISATLAYAGGPLTSSVHLPDGTVFEDLTAAYQELTALPGLPPAESQYAGRVFSLQVYRAPAPAGGPEPLMHPTGALPDFVFGDAISASLTYRDEDVAGMDETMLRLHFWTGSGWSLSGIKCSPLPDDNRVDCVLTGARTGVYALMETELHEVYMPLIIR